MTSKEIADRLREHAVAINMLGDEIFRLDKVTGAEYQNFIKQTDTIERQCKRLLNFAWEKVQAK